MNFWMGIDGGGSHLRVAITDDNLTVIAQTQGETANPSIIGRDLASHRIQAVIQSALTETGISVSRLSAVGVGIAGASAEHSDTWLRDTISKVLPGVLIVPSSDIEIALIGAHGEREGVLLLAGTGSIAYGVNSNGQSMRVGGWGYLIGDEGSGYWIGAKALQILMRMADGRETNSLEFRMLILNALQLKNEKDVLPWLYHPGQPRNREIAGLAPMILDAAAHGELISKQLVDAAANELTSMCRAVVMGLEMKPARIAFAGGLLKDENLLSNSVCHHLALESIPNILYSPVVGAALLAQFAAKGD